MMAASNNPEDANEVGLAGLICGQAIKSTLRHRNKPFYEQTFPLKEEELRLTEGWELFRRNKNTVRVRKPKPIDEQLEDEVWTLFAQMGFEHLSKDRNFKISVDSSNSGVPPKQIDVFAADDETAIVVECKASEVLRSRSLQKDLNETRGLQDAIRKSVHAGLAGARRTVVFLYATRNIDWSEPDRARAIENQIAILRDQQLEYYRGLVKSVGRAAKYQLLADLLEGRRIPGLNQKVSAARGRFGQNRFYQFTIEPERLLKIAYISHRRTGVEESASSYQRRFNPGQLKEIADHIRKQNGGIFPTNVVVNFRKDVNVRFDSSGPSQDDETVFGTLYLPNQYHSAFLIDGQHRLYGFALTNLADKGKIPVLAFEGLETEEEVKMFVDINSKQRKVGRSLLDDLATVILAPDAGPKERLRHFHARIAQNLASDPLSPLYDLVVTEWGPPSQARPINRPRLLTSIAASRLFGEVAGGDFRPGPLYGNGDETSVKRCTEFFMNLLGRIAKNSEIHWNRRNGLGGFLCTNNGIYAILRAVGDVIAYQCAKQNINEPWRLRPSELVDTIWYLFEPAVQYFAESDENRIMTDFRGDHGEGGYRISALLLMKLMNEAHPDFDPEELAQFLKERTVGDVDRAKSLVNEVVDSTREIVFSVLDDAFESDVSEWWRLAVPTAIRGRAATRAEKDEEGGPPHEFLELSDFQKIAESNWQTFDGVFAQSRSQRGRRAQLSWIERLGPLSKRFSQEGGHFINSSDLEWLEELAEHIRRVRLHPHGNRESLASA